MSINLKSDPIQKSFIQYLLPALSGMVIKSIFIMGASGYMAQLAHDYLDVMLKFFVLYALAWVMSCFVRNDTNPKLAMYAMSLGAVTNLVLDYFFVLEFGWGMKGAAYATAISQGVIAIVLLTHFWQQKGQLRLSLG